MKGINKAGSILVSNLKGHFLAVFLLICGYSSAQQTFSIKVIPSTIQSVPAIHSFAFATYSGKWVFIGGRVNGLHGFLPPFAFPTSGINDSVFVVDPVSDQRWSAPLSTLPDSLMEQLMCSNAEYVVRDSVLYIAGGYGWRTTATAFITFPYLTAINLPTLIQSVQSSLPLNNSMRQLRDTTMAITGGNMFFQDTTFSLVFGHRFDGTYNVSDASGFFVQKYSNEIRKFQIHDDGTTLALANYHAVRDTVNFHRRDFNLVPQVFPDQSLGQTAFSGVFRYGINLPYLNSIDLHPDTAIVNTSFNQHLSHYSSAVVPLYDSAFNCMNSIFLGGMGLYYLDTNHLEVLDSLVPFVSTISMVQRNSSGNLAEFAFSRSMPALIGTNATFVSDPLCPMWSEGILSLSRMDSVQRAGYLLGGILSPMSNIAATDASVSSANPIAYEVIIDTRDTTQSIRKEITFEVLDLVAFPNPTSGKITVSFRVKKQCEVTLEILDASGKNIQELFSKSFSPNTTILKEFDLKREEQGVYYIRARTKSGAAFQKIVLAR